MIITEKKKKAIFKGITEDHLHRFYLPEEKKYRDTIFLYPEQSVEGLEPDAEGWIEGAEGNLKFAPDPGWKSEVKDGKKKKGEDNNRE